MGGSRRARTAVPVSRPARALGIVSAAVALIALAVPAAIAFAIFRREGIVDHATLLAALLGTAVALLGLIIALFGAVVGKRAQSGSVVVGVLMNVGALLGFGFAVFLPLILRG